MSDSFVFGLKVASTTFLGLYAGGSLCINTCTVPANLASGDMEVSRSNWSRNFARESRAMPILHGASVVTGLAHYLLTRGTSNEDLPFLMASLAGELSLPYTLAVLMPINNQLDDEEQCKKQGSAYTRNLLEQWNIRHGVRTCLAVGTFMYAAYKLGGGK